MLTTHLKGARTHNLKGIDLDIRPGEVVAITGVSGSGKSSLALETLYAEGQRRFVESFSPYARQFLERLERPPIDELEPVAAGVAVDRRAPVKSSRSTVASMADLGAYLAGLFAREARASCPEHGVEGVELDVDSATRRLEAEVGSQPVVVTYPLLVGDRERYLVVREELAQAGYRRFWLDGKTVDLDQLKPSVAAKAGTLDVVVDRIQLNPENRERATQSIEQAWRQSAGMAHVIAGDKKLGLRRGLGCPVCQRALEPPRPGLFSSESPLGACPTCRGFGRILGMDLDKVIPETSRTLAKGAVRPWRGKSTGWERGQLKKLCARHDIPMDRAWSDLTPAQQALVVNGDGGWRGGKFPGIRGWFAWLETRTYKMHVRVLLSRYRAYDPCPACNGQRLNPTALAYRVNGLNLAQWYALEIAKARAQLETFQPATAQGALAKSELVARLTYLERVGLGYLTLDRQARTLSGGESQRVTLTAALGTSLHNALFVLDEPSVGLHPRDVRSLSVLIRELAERNNAVLVVEHDPELIAAADRVIELGPGAGALGGEIANDGSPAAVIKRGGATARAFAPPPPPGARRTPTGWLRVRGAKANNLRNLDVELPLGVIAAVTGPSGSGKTTLAVDIVYRSLARRFAVSDVDLPGEHDAIEGVEQIKRVTLVDQSPLGRTSRGNAATYTKAWDALRALLAKEPASVGAGLTASHFSFNVPGGRCETCSGDGFETIEMQFLADVRLVCPVCRGRRFTERVLEVKCRDASVAELLESTVDQILTKFDDQAGILRALKPVSDLGLGYLRLGQSLSTLSGGEAQRLKLARALSDSNRDALFILDEPSAGLHADEVGKMLQALELIVKAGGSVLLIDHDVDVMWRTDFIVDLGPGAGKEGGSVVAAATPELVAASETGTGEALRSRAQHGRTALSRSSKRGPAAAAVLKVTRAREHNLRDVSCEIPHNKLTVVTGPSGSGKSTLAFDVVFAEGQRRFLETLSPYARQFLPVMPRPDVDHVVGVPPSIALEQRTARAGGRSTVATVTEVAHYLRLMYAKVGIIHCPEHDQPIVHLGLDRLLEQVQALAGTHDLLAPAVRARKGTYLDVFAAAARDGIAKAVCDGKAVSTDDPPRLAKTREHDIDLVFAEKIAPRSITRSQVERVLRWGNGALKLKSGRGERVFSASGSCPVCGFSVPELDPRFFSFNTKQGRCERCDGEGTIETKARQKKGVPVPRVECPDCHGTRLLPLPRQVRFHGEPFGQLSKRTVGSALAYATALEFTEREGAIAEPIRRELERRLRFLEEVGLDYLALDRSADTLSGGEMQRLRLAAQLGAGLTGALYVLDEPTIGLHPRDTGRLLANLRRLVDLGSTVVVVEHDEDTIIAADHLLDLGPGGGAEGGMIVAEGPPERVLRSPASPTGRALSAPPAVRAPLPIDASTRWIELSGVREHNLKQVTLRIPTGRLTVVAGVSGSGKSTLVRKILLPAARRKLGLVDVVPGQHDALGSLHEIRRALAVDQSPIGRTPRSVPTTFLGIWDAIRGLFAATAEARLRGFGPARFSFNTPDGGRCVACQGQGVITHEMSFLPDTVTDCPTCSGNRFEPQTLGIEYQGLNIGQVLKLTAAQATELFRNHPNIRGCLQTLCDLGAGYITLGQGSHTLSGGEAQRLKLAAELTASSRHEATLYVLDEPTTGLHLADVSKLVAVLGRLVERGDTLVVIEHHPQVIAGADYVVELGPEGGARGGTLVAQGTPAEVARGSTATAPVIARVLGPATVTQSVRAPKARGRVSRAAAGRSR